MQAYQLYISTTLPGFRLMWDVSEYVDAENFSGYEETAEGDSIFEFWTSSLEASLSIDALNVLLINPSHFWDLKGKEVYLYYYGIKVFGGEVSEIDTDRNDKRVNITASSYGQIIKDMIYNFGYNRENVDAPYIYMDKASGANPKRVAEIMREKINYQLGENHDNREWSLDESDVDVEDFPFYKSLSRLPGGGHSMLYPIARRSSSTFQTSSDSLHAIAQRKGSGTWAIFRLPTGGTGFFPFNFVSYRFTPADGWISDSEVFTKTTVNFQFSQPSAAGVEIMRQWWLSINTWEDGWNHYYLLKAMVDPDNPNGAIGLFERRKDVSAAQKRIYSYKFGIGQNDVFTYHYKQPEPFGKKLKDLAIVTNSIIYIGADKKIHVKTRQENSPLPTVVADTIRLSYEELENTYEFPDAYVMEPWVKTALSHFFDQFFTGVFITAEMEVGRRNFQNSDFPLMLRTLPVGGNPGTGGNIKEIGYEKNILQIKSRIQIAGDTIDPPVDDDGDGDWDDRGGA